MKKYFSILIFLLGFCFAVAQNNITLGDYGIKGITLDYNISDIQYSATPSPGKIIIKGNADSGNNNHSGAGKKSTQELPAGQDYTIIDSNGNVWAVDENGNITQNGKIAQGGASTPENTNGVDKNGVANAVTAKGISVSFEEIEGKTLFAFDKVSYQKALTKDYKTIDGKFIPFKAVVKGKEEPLLAKVHISDSSVSADSLVFKTAKGVPIKSKKIGNDYQLNLKGLYSYATEQVQAVIKQDDKYNIAGVFQLVHLEPKGIKVHLVPTKGVTIDQQTIQQVQDIYSKVGVSLEVETEPTFDITPYLENGKLSSEDSSGDLTRYSPAQIRIINDYKAQNNTELAYYIFVTDRPSSNGQRGYMKLNGQFGFVFLSSNKTTKNDARVIAHELAHGAFKLEHPFKDHKQLKEGDANSLMDYNTNSTELIFTDWKQINDPKLKIYAFQSQNEGEYKVINLDYVCVNEFYEHKPNDTYLDLDGNTIKLKSNYKPYAFVGAKSSKHKGQLAIIKNTDTGKLFYPISSDGSEEKQGYRGYDAYNQFTIPFDGAIPSSSTENRVFANEECEYFVNGKYIGKQDKCRECDGLPSLQGRKEENKFTINLNTFTLPEVLSVEASDRNEITDNMTIIIDNDRRKNRTDGDTEDTQSNTNKLPSKKAENTYKTIATLWNNYLNKKYEEYLIPGRNFQNIAEAAIIEEKKKLDNHPLLMPELISKGILEKVSEQFIKDFFEDKIKGYVHHPEYKESSYNSNKKAEYEKAGSDLVHHFYKNTGEPYYKTKTIAEAIYKTEKGKENINNMIKLIDQVLQYQMSKPKEKINTKNFLDKPLDNAWFKDGIDPETFPSFTSKVLTKNINYDNLFQSGIDEEKLGLYTIGGTQAAKVAIKEFKPIFKNNEIGYEAVIILQYLDTFGVSEDDYTKDLGWNNTLGNINFVKFNYRGGVMAQWVLQHQYGYKPFNDFLTYTIKMKKLWKK
ncbi:hypothetical protein [Bergeyella zoohelcum]|uniref:Uncharacterized protein n=1 Tax=Bergeyella zoohelcum TaxID=1015 RepID=A0A7Z8YLG3_9FLAO|nr:hypothetical protein [Bergeyella zoohelcum]VDH02633.1 Uncharacterised protein [Bergeyella zoohelcum]